MRLDNKNEDGRHTATSSLSPIAAAQYVRMSTEHQQYSIENQSRMIAYYAQQNNFTIVRTYSDSAKSGLLLRNRLGLRQLLNDIIEGSCNFKTILIYDVSRWGRFQDFDEAACYEFLCRKSGIAVHYCAEPFANDGTSATSILKTLKRVMAAEYSRDLGDRVFDAQKKIVELGFARGGRPPYGFRRKLVSENGERSRILNSGERKNFHNDRIVLVPGPANEVDTVRKIFNLMSSGKVTCTEIVRIINRRKNTGRVWDFQLVRNVLKNPTYMGTSVFNRTSQKLKTPTVQIPPSGWIQKHNAFTPLVSQSTFRRAQAVMQHRAETMTYTDEELIDKLRWLLKVKGKISYRLIESTEGMPSATCYRLHFGSVRQLYRTVGFTPAGKFIRRCNGRAKGIRLRNEVTQKLLTLFPDHLTVLPRRRFPNPLIYLDRETPISVLLCRTVKTPGRKYVRVTIKPHKAEKSNITLLCHLNPEETDVQAFYLFKNMEIGTIRNFKEDDVWFETGKKLQQLLDFYEELKILSTSSIEFSKKISCVSANTLNTSQIEHGHVYPSTSRLA